jgi:hypothetical protein
VLPTTQLPQESRSEKKKFNIENERRWLRGLTDKLRCINYTADKCKQGHAMLQVRSTFRNFKTLMMYRISHIEQHGTAMSIGQKLGSVQLF